MKACSVITRMWNTVHTKPATNWIGAITHVISSLTAPPSVITAIRMKISSPAYMLPNSRSDRLSGRTSSSIRRSSRLAGASRILPITECAWNGAVNASATNSFRPLWLMPNQWISRNTPSDMPIVVLRSAVGTTRR